MGDMNDKVCLITGATSGIGLATAIGLAERGARILLIARNEARGEEARQAIGARCGRDDAVRVLIADLASQAAIRKVADEVLRVSRDWMCSYTARASFRGNGARVRTGSSLRLRSPISAVFCS